MVRVTGSTIRQHDCWSSLCIVVRAVLCIIKHWRFYLFKYKWTVLNWLVNIPTEVTQGYLSALRCHISKLQHKTFVFSICQVLQKANERNDFSVVVKQVSKKCEVLPTGGLFLFLEIKSSFLSEQVITDTLEHEPQKIRQIRLNTQRKHIYNLGNTVLCLVFVDSMCKTCYYTCTCEHKHTQFPDWSMENSVTSSWQTPQTSVWRWYEDLKLQTPSKAFVFPSWVPIRNIDSLHHL